MTNKAKHRRLLNKAVEMAEMLNGMEYPEAALVAMMVLTSLLARIQQEEFWPESKFQFGILESLLDMHIECAMRRMEIWSEQCLFAKRMRSREEELPIQ